MFYFSLPRMRKKNIIKKRASMLKRKKSMLSYYLLWPLCIQFWSRITDVTINVPYNMSTHIRVPHSISIQQLLPCNRYDDGVAKKSVRNRFWPVDAVLSFSSSSTSPCMLTSNVSVAFLWFPVRLHWYYKITVHLAHTQSFVATLLMNLSHTCCMQTQNNNNTSAWHASSIWCASAMSRRLCTHSFSNFLLSCAFVHSKYSKKLIKNMRVI